MILNEVGSNSNTSKVAGANEGGIMAGFGAYDTVYLIDENKVAQN
jgi:hypothetical protein